MHRTIRISTAVWRYRFSLALRTTLAAIGVTFPFCSALVVSLRGAFAILLVETGIALVTARSLLVALTAIPLCAVILLFTVPLTRIAMLLILFAILLVIFRLVGIRLTRCAAARCFLTGRLCIPHIHFVILLAVGKAVIILIPTARGTGILFRATSVLTDACTAVACHARSLFFILFVAHPDILSENFHTFSRMTGKKPQKISRGSLLNLALIISITFYFSFYKNIF